MMVIVKTESRYVSNDPIHAANYTSHNKDLDLAIGGGVNHTTIYEVTRDINITSTFSLKYVLSYSPTIHQMLQ